jgi:hypothetical protein
MKYMIVVHGLIGGFIVASTVEASAVVCARGVYRAGCVAPRGAVGYRSMSSLWPAATGEPNGGQALVRNQETKWMIRTEGASAMGRCLATWDRTSGMSKRQWKATCKRVVKENPGLYSKPF